MDVYNAQRDAANWSWDAHFQRQNLISEVTKKIDTKGSRRASMVRLQNSKKFFAEKSFVDDDDDDEDEEEEDQDADDAMMEYFAGTGSELVGAPPSVRPGLEAATEPAPSGVQLPRSIGGRHSVDTSMFSGPGRPSMDLASELSRPGIGFPRGSRLSSVGSGEDGYPGGRRGDETHHAALRHCNTSPQIGGGAPLTASKRHQQPDQGDRLAKLYSSLAPPPCSSSSPALALRPTGTAEHSERTSPADSTSACHDNAATSGGGAIGGTGGRTAGGTGGLTTGGTGGGTPAGGTAAGGTAISGGGGMTAASFARRNVHGPTNPRDPRRSSFMAHRNAAAAPAPLMHGPSGREAEVHAESSQSLAAADERDSDKSWMSTTYASTTSDSCSSDKKALKGHPRFGGNLVPLTSFKSLDSNLLLGSGGSPTSPSNAISPTPSVDSAFHRHHHHHRHPHTSSMGNLFDLDAGGGDDQDATSAAHHYSHYNGYTSSTANGTGRRLMSLPPPSIGGGGGGTKAAVPRTLGGGGAGGGSTLPPAVQSRGVVGRRIVPVNEDGPTWERGYGRAQTAPNLQDVLPPPIGGTGGGTVGGATPVDNKRDRFSGLTKLFKGLMPGAKPGK